MKIINCKPEILSPAGTFDSMKAAVNAGCDAIYMGGDLFSARAYAGNFSGEKMIEALEYCHLFDVKVYMTVNTLLKEEETQVLEEYMSPFYRAGLDGVIVQDLGVVRILKDAFPDLPLHASTQMSISSEYGARLMKQLGLTRIVPARELSLAEIAAIKDVVDIEIESFVHGAMCYAYSGKCLMSSFMGGRSGNRGRCAQPCRQCYTLLETKLLKSDVRNSSRHLEAFQGEKSGKKTTSSDSSARPLYPLSLKDMCTLEVLPHLIDAGIDSFKIEGRMKNPYYVAATTKGYQVARDTYAALINEQSHAEANACQMNSASSKNRSQDSSFKQNQYQTAHSDQPGNKTSGLQRAQDKNDESAQKMIGGRKIFWENLSGERQQKYLDLAKELTRDMQDIYNRGGFHTGYYFTSKGREMAADDRPNHSGLLVGSIQRIHPPVIDVKLIQDVNARDVLEVSGTGIELTSNAGEKAGRTLCLNAKEFKKLKPGMQVYRTRNNTLLDAINKDIIETERKIPGFALIRAIVGEPLSIILSDSLPINPRSMQDPSAFAHPLNSEEVFETQSLIDPSEKQETPDRRQMQEHQPSEGSKERICVQVFGELVEPATSAPITGETLLAKMEKTGGTHLDITAKCILDNNAFVKMSDFNNLRREAMELYKKTICRQYYRNIPASQESTLHENCSYE